ncbi:NDP-hexose 2,3-dehydratase family protein [Streptomyces sp. NPDC057307]|uniref:NDP-hexose 2,3-dehydratase family protein n=1 Tax=Streptomyces sp. NPDC057307 TaxID=3346096 RepID=UPI00363884FD
MSGTTRAPGSPRDHGLPGGPRLAEFRTALDAARGSVFTRAERIPLDALDRWSADPESGTIRHVSGKFFSVQGIDVTISTDGTTRRWHQPIISQPEIGVLGILVKEFDGVPHFLMQLKDEPGNINGIQLSPTVQATRSNYTRVHGGHAVPYLDYFLERARHRVIADVRQSEQGDWFLLKRNRNMIVETRGDVPPREGFHWLTIHQIHDLLDLDDMVNMDARSVLSCLPLWEFVRASAGDERVNSVVDAWSKTGHRGLHDTAELLSWITDARTRTEVDVRNAPLDRLPHWRRGTEIISHESDRFFDVIGVRVEAGGREVAGWDQPMVAARHVGLVAFLVTYADGVPHVLVGIRAEPGFADVAELGPTVQCVPAEHERGHPEWPPFLDTVLSAPADRVLYDTTLSEEGGRFFHTRNRYLIVEVDSDVDHPGFRWMTLHQLAELIHHSHYINVQARTLLACMATLATTRETGSAGPRTPEPATTAGQGGGV